MGALLLSLTRPDGLALGAAFVVWSLLPPEAADGEQIPARVATRGGWQRWAGPTLFVAGVLAHFLWRHATYGQWLPNTYYAKTGDLMGQLRTGLPYGVDFLRSYIAPWAVIAFAAGLVTRGRALRSQPVRLTLALCGLWFLYTLLIGGDMLGMFRFYVPMLLTVGTACLGELLTPAHVDGRRRVVVGAVVLMACLMILPSTVGKERRLISIHMSEKNLGGWKLVGDALATQLPTGTSIALGPAGYIPYRTGFVTYDLLGITDRHIAHKKIAFREGYPGHEKHDGISILSGQLDLLFLVDFYVTNQPRRGFIPPFNRELDIYQQPAFQRDYEVISLPLAGGKYVNCFKRRDLP